MMRIGSPVPQGRRLALCSESLFGQNAPSEKVGAVSPPQSMGGGLLAPPEPAGLLVPPQPAALLAPPEGFLIPPQQAGLQASGERVATETSEIALELVTPREAPPESAFHHGRGRRPGLNYTGFTLTLQIPDQAQQQPSSPSTVAASPPATDGIVEKMTSGSGSPEGQQPTPQQQQSLQKQKKQKKQKKPAPQQQQQQQPQPAPQQPHRRGAFMSMEAAAMTPLWEKTPEKAKVPQIGQCVLPAMPSPGFQDRLPLGSGLRATSPRSNKARRPSEGPTPAEVRALASACRGAAWMTPSTATPSSSKGSSPASGTPSATTMPLPQLLQWSGADEDDPSITSKELAKLGKEGARSVQRPVAAWELLQATPPTPLKVPPLLHRNYAGTMKSHYRFFSRASEDDSYEEHRQHMELRAELERREIEHKEEEFQELMEMVPCQNRPASPVGVPAASFSPRPSRTPSETSSCRSYRGDADASRRCRVPSIMPSIEILGGYQ